MTAAQEGTTGSVNPGERPFIRNTIVPESGGDPYRLTRHYPEPTVCPDCRAIYHEGRWQWLAEGAKVPPGAKETVCPACRRIRDGYPAGNLIISGAFLDLHRADVMAVLRAEEKLETAEHPLHRVASLDDVDGQIVITTTDIHLPRRIAEALYHAYEGELSLDYAEDEQSVRVSWRRADQHPPETMERAPILPYEIVDNGVVDSPAVSAYLLERIERLRRFSPRITSCRVVLEAPQNHHRKGGPFQVNIHVDLPGAVARVTRQQANDLHVAIAQAFDAAQRQLEDQARIQRGEVSPATRPTRARSRGCSRRPGTASCSPRMVMTCTFTETASL